MELVRIILAFILIATGLFVLAVATFGLYRFNYVLNRMHAAAKCDTLGTMLILLGIALLWGWQFDTIKLLIMIVFIWLVNPVAVHIIARVEVQTDPYIEEKCEVVEK